MEKILDYLRNAMGFQEPCVCKRDRDSDDDPPVMKKYRTVPNRFPKIMPSDEEEECTSRRPVAEASRIRFIPVTLDKDLPSTSTPSRILEPEKGLVKSLENFDFGRASNLPSSSSNSHWKSSSLFEKPTSISQRQTTLNSESLANSGNLKLKLNLSPKSNLLDGPRQHLQKPVQNKFFNKPAPKLVYKIDYDDDDEDDVYRFASHEPTNRTSYFKNGKKSTKCDDNVEVIEISDSEDYNYFVVKQPKSHKSVSSCNGHSSNRVEDELDEDDNDPCIPNCKNHRTRLSDTTNSYYRRSRSPKMNRDLIERFKYPLSLSKARLLNSYTPFWKSQKKLGIGQATTTQIRTPGRLPETTRAVIEKCIRLDEKKKYEELIKLTTSSFMRKSNSNKPSIFDFNNSRQRIQALKSLILSKSDDSLSTDAKLQNGAMDKGTPEEVSATVVLSDSDPDQAASADDASTSSSVRIVRVNSLKQSYKEKPVASSAWIDKLNEKYGSKEVEKKQEEKYVIFESTTQSKLNREFDLMKKEHFIKALRIDLTVESEEREEVPLPELTDEQHAIINNALRPNPPNQVLIEKFNLSITRRDISTLAGLTWLNDEVINFYMNLIMERCQQKKDLPKVYGMNTFFYPKLMQTGHSGLKRWTRKVDIFSHDLIVAPIHLGIHWCMSIIDFRNKTVKYFDSMGGNNMECCDALVKYLEEECMDKKKTKFDTSDWKKECVKDIPQQMNGSDCGMFSCTFAEFIARDVPITFSQSDMPYLRRKMVLEIVQGKLLL